MERLQLALSCVTASVVTSRSSSFRALDNDAQAYAIALNNADPAPLRGRPPTALAIQEYILLHPRIDRGRATWDLSIAGYSYRLSARGGGEILAFHWHPEGLSSVKHPHAHVGSAMIASDAPIRPTSFHRTHIPTGQVFVDDVVRFAVAELDVEPLRGDWDAVLAGIARQRGQVT